MNVTIRAVDGFWHRGKVIEPGTVFELDVRDAANVVASRKAIALDPPAYQVALVELQRATLRLLRQHERPEPRDPRWVGVGSMPSPLRRSS